MDVSWNDEEEYFNFLGTVFDVRGAKRILAKRGAKVGQMPIEGVASLVGKPNAGLEGIIVGGITVDWEKAASADVDTSVPVILAYAKSGAFLPIDGWHRIARAVLDGKTHLPAVALTKAESKRIRRS